MVLREEISIPNLKAKGPLGELSVLVPASWTPAPSSPEKPLIEEVSPSTPKSKAFNTGRGERYSPINMSSNAPSAPPKWSLEIENTGTRTKSRSARIEVQVPLLVRAPNDIVCSFAFLRCFFLQAKEDHASTSLDLERNRLLLDCKPKYALLDVPVLADTGSGIFGLDIDNAKAEWDINLGRLVISAPIVTH